MILIKPTRTAQPQYRANIDWSNPITLGLLDAQVPANHALTAVNSPELVPGSRGLAFKGNGTSSYFQEVLPSITFAPSTRGVTILALVHGAAGAADRRAFAFGNSASANAIIAIGNADAGDTERGRVFCRDDSNGGAVFTLYTTAKVFEAAAPHLMVIRLSAAGQEAFVDGFLSASNATTVGTTTVNRKGIGALVRNTVGNYSATRVFLGALWDRALTYQEIAAVSANPWQLFEPRRIWVPVSTSADVNQPLTGIPTTVFTGNLAASTTILLSGTQNAVFTGTITPTQDAVVAISGQGATVSAGTVAPAISKALSGQAATASAGTITPTQDAVVAISGQAATASAGTVAPAISKALSGQETTAAAGTIGATQDAVVAISGQGATVSAGTVTPAVSKALSGQETTAAAGTIGATQDILVSITGLSVAPATGTLGAASSSTVALSGQQIVLSPGILTSATPDVFVALSGLLLTAYTGNLYIEGSWTPVNDSMSATWIPVVDTNPNTWIPVVDTNPNSWTQI